YHEPSIQHALKKHTAIGCQWASVDQEGFIDRPLGLSRHLVKCDQPSAYIAIVCRKHRYGGSHIRKAALVFDREGLVVHTDVVRAGIEKPSLGVIRDRLHILSAL